jgi:hypothetical protein
LLLVIHCSAASRPFCSLEKPQRRVEHAFMIKAVNRVGRGYAVQAEPSQLATQAGQREGAAATLTKIIQRLQLAMQGRIEGDGASPTRDLDRPVRRLLLHFRHDLHHQNIEGARVESKLPQRRFALKPPSQYASPSISTA